MVLINVYEALVYKPGDLYDVNGVKGVVFYVDETGCITFTTGACVNNFTLEKPASNVLPGLTMPEQRLDGTWTPGWWDIEDWAKYYSIISGKMNDDGTVSDANLPNKTSSTS